MKNIKRVIVMLSMITVTASLALTGCGKEKMEPPEVTAEAFYNIYVLGDASKLEKLGVNKSEYESITETERNSIKSATKKNFTAAGLTVSDEQLNKIADSELAALKKLKSKIETTSINEDKASVKLSTTYADIVPADDKAATEAIEEIKNMGLTSQSEAENKLVEIYVKKIVENINSIEPSTNTKEKTFTFKIETFNVNGKAKDIWVPEDIQGFGNDLGKMITGQNL